MAWACSPRLGQDLPLRHAIASEARPRLRSSEEAFDVQGLANTLWAFARLRLRDTPLIEAMAEASL
eukprot:CAMPEP_0197924196 /NCGR_PEP_ID=MMETSP1439-20131203/95283_1 /TAXON_ID=66791 /ORGANISM="Gonyaulax spinifera, Strain CCMP409" /LENGTH=65 /DNA_ID=CAMNT_0043546605 /DNA_START=32 /DNA_END=225 /DNA_ORIENTATION=-